MTIGYLIPGCCHFRVRDTRAFLVPGFGHVKGFVATIDNKEDYLLTVQYEGITVYPDGTNWWVGV